MATTGAACFWVASMQLARLAEEAQLRRMADAAAGLADILARDVVPPTPESFAAAAGEIAATARVNFDLLAIDGTPVETVAGPSPARGESGWQGGAESLLAEARAGRIARTSRYDAASRRRVHAAAVVIGPPHAPVGIVRATADTAAADRELAAAQRRLLAGCLLAVAAAIAAGYALARRAARPVRELSNAARRLAAGQFDVSLPVAEAAELSDLATAIAGLREQLVERGLTIGRQGTQQEAVLGSMIEGVLAIDARQRIVSINHGAAELLGLDPGKSLRRPLQEVVRNPDLRRFALLAIDCREPVEDDLVIRGARDRTIRLRGTALRDVSGEGGAVIVLNDACPFSETHAIGTAFALADPRVTYLHKANGGLSSARNSGIDYALAAWPGLRAIYFLDADNRLTGSAIASAASVMTRKGADWVYPHIDKFGMEWSGNYAAPYSRLAHVTFDNLCEAGSLVARHVFDAGLRFDETMKDGFEDWDFWLQAIAQGFTGELDPVLGLEYRQRAESMVASSNRRRARIIGELRVKHRALFAPARLLAWEHAEAPRFAIFEAEKNVVRGLTDPAQPQHLWRWEEWLQAFHAEACEPETFGTPPFLICLSGEVIEELRRLRLWPGVLWQIERLATRYALVVLHAVPDPVRIAFSVVLPGEFEPEGPPTGHALRQTSLRDQLSNPPNTAPNGLDRFKRDVVHLIIKAPFTGPLPGDPGLRRLLDANCGLRTKRQARRWSWRSTAYMPQLRRYHKHLGNSLGGSPIFVRSPTAPGRPQIGFALPIAAFGGVERVAVALAGILRASGYDTHLILLGAPEAALADQLIKNFDSIAILAVPSIPLDGGKQRFFGHNFAVAADLERITPPLIGLCAGLDAIILSHTVTFSAMLGQLREL
ncbi:MAG: HAMP domain-containing protein, partial [Planctomycetota bacterium]